MARKKYNKLVRDKIPEIIRKNGSRPIIRIANKKEYWRLLKTKLFEEVAEFDQAESVEELADILEVLDAIIAAQKISPRKLKNLQKQKAAKRGGFKKRIILKETR